MTERTGSRRLLPLAWLLLCVVGASAQNTSVPFKRFVVLPAVNQTDSQRVAIWTLGLQYLLQERIAELPGLQVLRLQDAPDLLEQIQARKLDVASVAGRNQIVDTLRPDLLVAPTILQAGEMWEVKCDLIAPAAGAKPIAEIPPASAASPLTVVDQLTVAVLKQALGVPQVELAPYADPSYDYRELQGLVYALWLWPYVGRDNAQRGQLEKAVEQMTRTLANRPLHHLVWQRALEQAEAGGTVRTLLPQLEAWSKLNRRLNTARVNLLVGRARTLAGQLVEAKDPLIKAAELSKGSLRSVEALVEMYRRQGQIDAALAQYEAASKMWANVLPFKTRRGDLALANHKPDVAVKAYQSALAQDPQNPALYKGLVEALVTLDKAAEALPYAVQLTTLKPEDLDGQLLLARAALKAGQLEAARTAADKVVSGRPEDAVALATLGQIALGQGDLPKAEEAFAAAVAKDPKDLASYRGLSQARLGRPEPDLAGAAEALVAALKTAPEIERPELLLDLADLRFLDQKYDAAVKLLDQAAEMLPMRADVPYLKANVLLYAGQMPACVEALRKAIELDPGARGFGQQMIAGYEATEANKQGFDNLKLVLGYLYQVSGRTRDARRKYNDYLVSGSAAQMGEWVREQLAKLDTTG